jgi:hypothetical protein
MNMPLHDKILLSYPGRVFFNPVKVLLVLAVSVSVLY